MRILLAVDGSKAAHAAVSTLIRSLDNFKVRPQVDVVFVHLPVPQVGVVHGIAIGGSALDTYYEQDAQEFLAPTRKMLDQAGITYGCHVLVGNVAEQINSFAERNQCDMIYMGTRGMTTISSLLLGSTANKVLHMAKVPVTLVPDRGQLDGIASENSRT